MILIVNGEQIEVSTGYFSDSVDTEGIFDGEQFFAIQENVCSFTH